MSSPSGQVPERGTAPIDTRARRLLQFLRQHRDKPISMATMLKLYGRFWLVFLALGALVAVWAYLCNDTCTMAAVASGVTVLILRDIGYARRMAGTWGIYRQVLDWNKIDLLLNDGHPAVDRIANNEPGR